MYYNCLTVTWITMIRGVTLTVTGFCKRFNIFVCKYFRFKNKSAY